MVKRKKKFSEKLLINLFLWILLPVGLLFVISGITYGRSLKNEVRRNNETALSYCWENVEEIFSGMVTISSIINNDSVFVSSLQDDSLGHYDRYVLFNRMLQNIYLENFGLGDSTWIYLKDESQNSYCNHAKYPVVSSEDFLARQSNSQGQICWDYNAVNDRTGVRFFSMSRTLFNNNSLSDPAGVLTISIEESHLRTVLDRYVNLNADCAILYVDNGSLITGYHNGSYPIEDIYKACLPNLNQHQQDFRVKIQGESYLANDYTIDSLFDFDGHNIHFLILSNYDAVFAEVDATIMSVGLGLAAAYLVVLLIAASIPQKLIRPIQELETQVRAFRVGNTPIQPKSIDTQEMESLFNGFHYLTDSVNQLFITLKEESRIKENYQYESLRAQINPHFLFNTLNSIRFSAQIIHADNITDNIDALSQMLRYSMAKEDELVQFRREIDNIRNYLHIQNNRFGNSIQLELDPSVEAYAGNLVYKFILQPIVENCILHGFKDYTDKGIIFISCCEEQDAFVIRVQDNGRGFSEEALQNWQTLMEEPGGKFSGLGLAAVHKIIRITGGVRYGLTIDSIQDEGAEITYRLPLKKSTEVKPCDPGNDRR